MKRFATLLIHVSLAVTLVVTPGCLLGSPLAAISGEPYGMVRDDWKALQGKNGRIWSSAPFFAAIDLPIAFCLDTAFLPISLLTWLIFSGSSNEDDVWAKDAQDDRDEEEDEEPEGDEDDEDEPDGRDLSD